MMKKSLVERRQAIRAKRILSIQYRLVKSRHKNSDTRWYLSTTQDMSVSGIAFLSEPAYNIGDIIEIHAVMSGVIDVIKGYGQVVRIEEKGRQAAYLTAVKFVDYKPSRRWSK